MQEMETVIRHPLFQFIFSGCVVLIQLYFVSLLKPIKKTLDRLDISINKIWDAVGDVEKQLNTLQGEHNAHKDTCHTRRGSE